MRSALGVLASLLASTLAAAGESSHAGPHKNDTDYKLGYTPLKTEWTDKVGTNPWPEYPRPRLQRSAWKNLNGVWRYQNTNGKALRNPPFGQKLEDPVLVPSCLESALSGKWIPNLPK